MTRREKSLRSVGYWFQDAQLEIFNQVNKYMKHQGINQTELAQKLNVSKGYISQILHGNFNFSLKKLIELANSIGLIVKIRFTTFDEELRKDKRDKEFLKGHFQTEFIPVINHSCLDKLTGKYYPLTSNFQLKTSNKNKELA